MSLVLVVVFSLVTSAYAGEIQRKLTSESAIEAIAKRGVMKVGMDVFVPWAMKDKKGELIGFEIDIAKKLAEDASGNVHISTELWGERESDGAPDHAWICPCEVTLPKEGQ